MNLKSVFDKNTDTDFNNICNIAENNYSDEELIKMLKDGNIAQKHYSALMLNNIKNPEEACILLNHLTGCDGKIREAVAYKISDLLQNNKDFKTHLLNIDKEKLATVFADATIDINANICRLVIESVQYLKDNKTFISKYLKHVFTCIEDAFNSLDSFSFKDKKYVINKQLFKLYWTLETIISLTDFIDENNLYKILERSIQEEEYTIREQVAKILIKTKSNLFDNMKNKLIKDENYYVRSIFTKKN